MDITAQHNAETELTALVDAASQGDFSVKMDVSKYDGFFHQIGSTINGLLVGLQDMSEMLSQLRPAFEAFEDSDGDGSHDD